MKIKNLFNSLLKNSTHYKNLSNLNWQEYNFYSTNQNQVQSQMYVYNIIKTMI